MGFQLVMNAVEGFYFDASQESREDWVQRLITSSQDNRRYMIEGLLRRAGQAISDDSVAPFIDAADRLDNKKRPQMIIYSDPPKNVGMSEEEPRLQQKDRLAATIREEQQETALDVPDTNDITVSPSSMEESILVCEEQARQEPIIAAEELPVIPGMIEESLVAKEEPAASLSGEFVAADDNDDDFSEDAYGQYEAERQAPSPYEDVPDEMLIDTLDTDSHEEKEADRMAVIMEEGEEVEDAVRESESSEEEDTLEDEFDLGVGVLSDDCFEEDEELVEFESEDFAAMGIDPFRPTRAKPGSEAKVLMLSARYAAGLPLWHPQDCYEHGPREFDLMGTDDARQE